MKSSATIVPRIRSKAWPKRTCKGNSAACSTVLDKRERRIIDERFGLTGKTPMTLEEVGREFGVTRERIRQLQNVALTKMRKALRRKDKPLPKPAAGSSDAFAAT